MALFENYERRIEQINKALKENGIASIEEAKEICDKAGVDAYNIVKGIQPICFENACWAYTVGAAIALKIKLHQQVMPQNILVLVYNHFVFQDQLLMIVK